MISNPLARGFYTVEEAARLVEVGNATRIRGWLNGYPGRHVGPLLTRDYQPLGTAQELSFLDLIEVRFVEHFREQQVKVSTLRKALDTARKIFGGDKPFASDRMKFVTDGKDIFAEEVLKETAKLTHDTALWSLITRQYEIYEFIKAQLLKGLTFNTTTGLARRWVPRPGEFPDIIIDPRIAYGQPVGPSSVPTATLYDAWQAEGNNIALVSDWYSVSLVEAQMAVAFENHLRQPRQVLLA